MTAARSTDTDDTSRPAWSGTWRVLRYGGKKPEVPTFYRATTDRWDVIKKEASGRHVARHPILEIDGSTLVLKDEGAPDDAAEKWTVEVGDDRVVVTAETGPHHGAVGIAERVESIDA